MGLALVRTQRVFKMVPEAKKELFKLKSGDSYKEEAKMGVPLGSLVSGWS